MHVTSDPFADMNLNAPETTLRGALCAVLIHFTLAGTQPLLAQQFELTGGTVARAAIDTNAAVTLNVPNPDPCNPRQPDGLLTDRQWDGNNFTPNTFLNSIPNLADPANPWDLFYHYNLTARVDGKYRVGSGEGSICDCVPLESKQHETRAQSMMFMAAHGDQSGELFIQWRNLSQVKTRNTDQSGAADGSSVSGLSISFKVTGPGLLDGTPVDVHFRYNTTAIGWTSHEGGGEDPILLDLQRLELDGNSLIPAGVNPNGHALYNIDGQMTLLAGQVYTLDLVATTEALIQAPSQKLNGVCLQHYIDSAFAQVMGRMILSFSAVAQPLPGSPTQVAGCDFELAYSVDIGSDNEWSDPAGGGPLDPGDLYPRGYFGGAFPALYRDDAGWFAGVDPAPTPGVPGSVAPVGTGVPVDPTRDGYFNVDAAALLPFDPAIFSYGPGQPAILRADVESATGASACIRHPRYLLLSERDSAIMPYFAGFPTGAPANSLAPGGPHGQTGDRDEVVHYELSVYGGGASGPDPVYDEEGFDPALFPNPAAGSPGFNDDINALAGFYTDPGLSGCADFTCVSVSAEARYGLDPGIIYGAPAGGTLVPLITPNDLGLPWGVDIDALDFTWWVDPASGQVALALLFSVSEDLPVTIENESGGRDPAIVYVSFMDGTHQPTGVSGVDDVDGITVVPCPVQVALRVGTTTLPNGEVCSQYSHTLAATGGFGMGYSWAVTSGALPPGLSLNASTGEIAGVPSIDGSFSFDLTVTDATGALLTQTLSLTIDPAPPPPSIVIVPLANGRPKVSYNETISVAGGCQPVYLTVESGQLPTGLLLDVVTGTISGIPVAPGLFSFDLKATDASGATSVGSFSIDIQGTAPPDIHLLANQVGPLSPGTGWNLTLDATGGTPPYQFFAFSPPPGISLVGNLLSGTASAPAILGIDIDMLDSQFEQGSDVVYVITLDPLAGDPQIQPIPVQDWVVGQQVDLQPVVVGGTPPFTFVWAHGQPPVGIGLDPNTGRIHGVPVAPESGHIPLLVTDANSREDAVLVPYTIHAGFPGGYPAWKLFHGVAIDDEDLEPDTFPAIGEYFMDLDPGLGDSPSLYRIRRLANGLFRLDFPATGVPDVGVRLQRLDPVTLNWLPHFSNPFPLESSPGIFRLKFESQ